MATVARGYLVLWKGMPMKQGSAAGLRKRELGRLFYPTGFSSVWPTRSSARTAMRRAIKAWGRDDPMEWGIKQLRLARTP